MSPKPLITDILSPPFKDSKTKLNMNIFKSLLPFLVIPFIISCDSKPKIIVADATEATPLNAEAASDVSSTDASTNTGSGGVHQVIANEVLQTDRYTYLNVTEGTQTFWIATAKKEAAKGKAYLYKGGLMKTNFESLEFKRTFDTIYLVGNIIDATEHPGGNIAGTAPENTSVPSSSNSVANKPVKDAVKLSELFKNKAKYDGQVITVSGTCVKVNNGIMGRNWIHIEDGSKTGGKPLDLTITTNLNIPLGSKIAMTGKIALNKDFGAGYRYDIIMEDAGGM